MQAVSRPAHGSAREVFAVAVRLDIATFDNSPHASHRKGSTVLPGELGEIWWRMAQGAGNWAVADSLRTVTACAIGCEELCTVEG